MYKRQELLINRINMALANDLGNLLSRTTAMADKYFGGELPEMCIRDRYPYYTSCWQRCQYLAKIKYADTSFYF